MNIAEVFDHFIIACKAEGLAPKTITWYKARLLPFVTVYGERELSQVTRNHIRVYIVELQERNHRYNNHPYHEQLNGGLAAATIRSHVRAIRRFFT